MCAKSKNEQFKKTPPGESVSSKRTPLHEAGTVNSDPGGASFMTYQEQLKSPKWQRKRLEILERDNFTCNYCKSKDNELHVHHLIYKPNTKIWEYNNDELVTFCANCHTDFHSYCNQLILHIWYLQDQSIINLPRLFNLLTYLEYLPHKRLNKLINEAIDFKLKHQ